VRRKSYAPSTKSGREGPTGIGASRSFVVRRRGSPHQPCATAQVAWRERSRIIACTAITRTARRVQLRTDVRLSKRRPRAQSRTPATIALPALPEPDAPRPRRPTPPEGEITAPLSAPPLGSFSASAKKGSPRSSPWPRTRAEVDVALHSIGLALDDLLDGTRIPDSSPEPRCGDLRSELRERFENAEVDARRVDVIIDGERVILVGIVGDRLSRLIAEDIAWSLPEVVECENRLAVA
jgi:hypothetical protein